MSIQNTVCMLLKYSFAGRGSKTSICKLLFIQLMPKISRPRILLNQQLIQKHLVGSDKLLRIHSATKLLFRGMGAWRKTMEPQKPDNSTGLGPEVIERQRVAKASGAKSP